METQPRSIINKNSLEDMIFESTLKSAVKLRKYLETSGRYSDLRKNEVEKTDFEKKIVNLINYGVDVFAKKYQKVTFPVQPEDVHKVPSLEQFKEENVSIGGFYDPIFHQIYYVDGLDYMTTYSFIQHEAIHSKGFVNFKNITENNKLIEFKEHQVGVSFSDDNYIYLRNLNEAITEYLNKKLINESMEGGKIGIEKNKMVAELNYLFSEEGKPIKDPKEIMSWFETNSEKKEGEVTLASYEYKPQRNFLENMIEDFMKKNSELFPSKEEAEDVFFKAYFTGDLKEIENMIDAVYGVGVFAKMKRVDRSEIGGGTLQLKQGDTLSAFLETIKRDNISF